MIFVNIVKSYNFSHEGKDISYFAILQQFLVRDRLQSQ